MENKLNLLASNFHCFAWFITLLVLYFISSNLKHITALREHQLLQSTIIQIPVHRHTNGVNITGNGGYTGGNGRRLFTLPNDFTSLWTIVITPLKLFWGEREWALPESKISDILQATSHDKSHGQLSYRTYLGMCG